MKRWLILLLLAASAAVHWPGERADFVFDDDDFIVTNQSVRSFPAAIAAFGEPFPRAQIIRGLYRPLTNFSYAIDFSRAGLNSRAYHESNVLIYLAIVLLVYALARSYRLGVGASGAAALLFSLHPVHCDVVDPISGRSELLSLFFSLVCLLAFLRVARSQLPRAASGRVRATEFAIAAGGVLAYACACLSKETGVVLPVILAVHYLLFAPPEEARLSSRRGGRVLLPYAVVLVGYLAVRLSVLEAFAPTINVFEGASWGRQLHAMGLAYYLYVKLLLFPDILQVDFYYRQFFADPGSTLIQSALGWLAAGGMLALGALLTWRHWQGVATDASSPREVPAHSAIALAALAIALAFFFPYSHVVAIGALMAERFLFAPSLGVALLLATAASAALRHGFPQRAAMGARLGLWAVVVCLALLGAERSHRRALEWRDDVALWRAAARDIPNDYQVHSNLATAHMDRGELEAARAPMQRALQIDPSEPKVRRNQRRLEQLLEARQ